MPYRKFQVVFAVIYDCYTLTHVFFHNADRTDRQFFFLQIDKHGRKSYTYLNPTKLVLPGNTIEQNVFDLATNSMKAVRIHNLNNRVFVVDDVSVTPEDCVICFKTMKDNSVQLPCGHVHCLSCIHRWFKTNRTCPLCRAPCPQKLPPVPKK